MSRDGDVFRAALRYSMKMVISVVVNTEAEARFTRQASDRYAVQDIGIPGRVRLIAFEVGRPRQPGEYDRGVEPSLEPRIVAVLAGARRDRLGVDLEPVLTRYRNTRTGQA